MKRIIDCPVCDGKAELKAEQKKRTYRNEKFDVVEQYYQCNTCNYSFTDNEVDQYNLDLLHNKCREKYQIPFPEQLVNIRETYGLTQTKMSELLGFGPNQYRLYENGEMPSSANAMLLRLLLRPKTFKNIILENKQDDSDKLLADLFRKIEKKINETNKSSLVKMLFPDDIIPSSSTGYALPDFKKFANMVIYFLDVAQFKTKLNKLLFYADFTHFKYFGRSISGCGYAAIDMGPVPDNYKLIFGLLEEANFVYSENETFQEREVEKYFPAQSFDPSIFTESEKDTLKSICNKLGSLKTQSLIDKSHDEVAWQINSINKVIIDYSFFAPHLKAL
jgi:putative zinc finger/helix-turn-helix YgiT family protein